MKQIFRKKLGLSKKNVAKLTIVNKTHYRTTDLRKLFSQCMKREGVTNCHVEVVYHKISRIAGRAGVNSYRVLMKLPKSTYGKEAGTDGTESWQYREIAQLSPDNTAWVAKVFMHELGHNLGLRHKEMAPIGNIDCSWTQDYVVRAKEKKPKKQVDLVLIRYKKALANLNKNKTKLKRAETLVKKWAKKVKHYERKYPDRVGG